VFCCVAGGPKPKKQARYAAPEDRSADERKELIEDDATASITLKLVESSDDVVQRILDGYIQGTQLQAVLVEFPRVLLPSFQPTLLALQQMSTNLDLPFADIIALSQSPADANSIPPPSYATEEGFRFDLSSLLKDDQDGELSMSLDDEAEAVVDKLRDRSDLDPAQADALVMCLRRGFSFTQGPPGTGKSYTAKALFKVLLANKEKAYLGPIICVTYTNHALDQLLENLVESGIERIIRIGQRSKSALLQGLNLNVVRETGVGGQTRTEKAKRWEYGKKLDECAKELNERLVELAETGDEEALSTYLLSSQSHHYKELYEPDEQGQQDG